jgi:hypothetical protein
VPLLRVLKRPQHDVCVPRQLNWKWGPITSYRMELTEIDSAGEHGNDLMEIVASLSANSRTQELLLDSFMQGFMHELCADIWPDSIHPSALSSRENS